MIFHFSGLDPKNHQLFRLTKTKYPKRFDRQKKCFYISQGASQAFFFPSLSSPKPLANPNSEDRGGTHRANFLALSEIRRPIGSLTDQNSYRSGMNPRANWDQIDISRIDSMSIYSIDWYSTGRDKWRHKFRTLERKIRTSLIVWKLLQFCSVIRKDSKWLEEPKLTSWG